MNVLLTGATGFVGRAVLERVSADSDIVASTAGRRLPRASGTKHTSVGDIGPDTDWRAALEGVGTVIHLAGRAHVMHDADPDPAEAFRRVNVHGTLNLARQAAEARVARFVFVSSIKVNGESTVAGRPFRADDEPGPADLYGLSKLEAESRLRELARATGMQYVVVRPPLVYGPGVGANFRALMTWLARELPLPLGNVQNLRSLVSVGNLADFLVTCARHSAAGNETLLVSDGEDLSTTDLLVRLASALGRRPRLVPVPLAVLRAGAALTGKRHLFTRLCGSLQVDVSKAAELLGWRPPLSVDEGLRLAAEQFLRDSGR